MDSPYSDMLRLTRPEHTDDRFGRRHPKMARGDRAKIFAPFAALAGFDEAIRSRQAPYGPRCVPGPEEQLRLERTLERLHRATRTGPLARQNRVEVRVVYFEVCTVAGHAAFGREGLYRTVTGIVQRVDVVNRTLILEDRTLPFRDIREITTGKGECEYEYEQND